MSQNYSPQTVTKDLVLCIDGTQGFKGYNAIKKPTQIGQCVLWLDADDPSSITHSSNAVSSWADKSSSGYKASQSTSSYQPTYNATTVNGKGAIEFDGIDNSLEVSTPGITLGANGGVAFFMVCRQVEFDNNGGNFYFGNVSSGTKQNYMGVGTSGGNSMDWRLYGDNVSGNETESFYTDTTGYHIHVGIWEKDANGVGGAANIHQFFDGYRANYKTSSINTSNFTTTDTAYIGRQHGGSSSYCKFNVCEIILFNKALTIKERQMVEFYLSRKWDIPLMVSYDTNFQRWPLDLTSNASNSTANTTHTWMSPSVNAARGIFLQNDSGRYVRYTQTDALSDLGAKGSFTMEWAAAFIGHLDNGTNYCLFRNEDYQDNGFLMRYDGGSWRTYMRTNQASTATGMTVDTADRSYPGEWAHWQLVAFADDDLKVYKDGVEVYAATNIKMPVQAVEPLSFLADSSQGFVGEVAFLRFYQRALNATERQTNYLAMRERMNGIPKIVRPREVEVYLDSHQSRSFGASTWYDMGVNAGNNAGGTITNGVGQIGASSTAWPKCYDFDGIDDYINLSTFAGSFNFGSNPYSISVWLQYASGNAQPDRIFEKVATGRISLIWVGGNKAMYQGYNGSSWDAGVTSAVALTNDVWTNVCVTKTGTTATMYINGSDAATGTAHSDYNDTTSGSAALGTAGGGEAVILGKVK